MPRPGRPPYSPAPTPPTTRRARQGRRAAGKSRQRGASHVFPRLIASGELHVGDWVLLVGRIDDGGARSFVFVGEQPVAGLLGGPGDEPHDTARFEVVTEDGEVVQAYEFGETVHQLICQAAHPTLPGPGLSLDDRMVAMKSRSFLVHVLHAAIDGVVR